ncbi:MAG: hypothetical protein M3O62_06350 [Pseudomonadota bacterium]|nr:hypothetical protein [Pseudomonadota bacterium]
MDVSDLGTEVEVVEVDGREVVIEFQRHSDGMWSIAKVTIGEYPLIRDGDESFATKTEMIEWVTEVVRSEPGDMHDGHAAATL